MLYAGAWTGFAGAFFLGFLISRLRASLFPMHRACHRLLMVARASGGWGFTRVSQMIGNGHILWRHGDWTQ
jgi:hypothetical protein